MDHLNNRRPGGVVHRCMDCSSPVKLDEATSLVMYVEPLFSLADARTWFSLHDGTGSSGG
jgi:hypothetical protein